MENSNYKILDSVYIYIYYICKSSCMKVAGLGLVNLDLSFWRCLTVWANRTPNPIGYSLSSWYSREGIYNSRMMSYKMKVQIVEVSTGICVDSCCLWISYVQGSQCRCQQAYRTLCDEVLLPSSQLRSNVCLWSYSKALFALGSEIPNLSSKNSVCRP